MNLAEHIMGVDYGAKLAGTTTAAKVIDGKLEIWQSERGKNADEWLLDLTKTLQPKQLFIDAPLTLPKVYAKGDFNAKEEYFYRACDIQVHAMSPMFIGGLTARAIKLRASLSESGIAVLETYPSQLAKLLLGHLPDYKKGLATLPIFSEALQGLLPYPVLKPPVNWHQFDGLLAWLSGYRHNQHEAILYGVAKEGRIIV